MPRPMTPYRVDARRGPWVALVGAGPGDPGAADTARGRAARSGADVVLHDSCRRPPRCSTSPAPAPASSTSARGRATAAASATSSSCFVAHHGEGARYRVVRLKGGSATLLGHGMEEVRAVRVATRTPRSCPACRRRWPHRRSVASPVAERSVSAQLTIISGHFVNAGNNWGHAGQAHPARSSVLMAATTGSSVARRVDRRRHRQRGDADGRRRRRRAGPGQASLRTELGRGGCTYRTAARAVRRRDRCRRRPTGIGRRKRRARRGVMAPPPAATTSCRGGRRGPVRARSHPCGAGRAGRSSTRPHRAA